jgi:hypothetical protein
MPKNALLFLLALAGAARASSQNTVVVQTAVVDYPSNTITVTGLNFGSSAPTLKLSGVALPVLSYNPSTV